MSCTLGDSGNRAYDQERRRLYTYEQPKNLTADIVPLSDNNFYFPRRVRSLLLPFQSSYFDINPLMQVTEEAIVDGVFPLVNFAGLEALYSIDETFTISANPCLSSFIGLTRLTYIGNSFFVQHNLELNSLQGLHELDTVEGQIKVVNNPVLQDLNGLTRIRKIGHSFDIFGNAMLTEVGSFVHLQTVGINLVIANNPLLNAITENGHAWNLSIIGGDLKVDNNSELAVSLCVLDSCLSRK